MRVYFGNIPCHDICSKFTFYSFPILSSGLTLLAMFEVIIWIYLFIVFNILYTPMREPHWVLSFSAVKLNNIQHFLVIHSLCTWNQFSCSFFVVTPIHKYRSSILFGFSTTSLTNIQLIRPDHFPSANVVLFNIIFSHIISLNVQSLTLLHFLHSIPQLWNARASPLFQTI